MLSSCQWLPREDIKRLQDAALADIVLHAWRSVPFYRDRLAPLMRGDGTVDLTAWAQVPCLTRRDLQDNFDDLKSTSCPASHGAVRLAKSSGSTAEPVGVLTTNFCDVGSSVANARGMDWAKVDYSLNQAQIKPVGESAAPYPGKQIDASWAPYWLDGAASGNWHLLDHTTAHNLQLEWLAKRGRCYLNTMPSNAAEIARRVALEPALKPDLAGIMTLGEIVTDDLRTHVREHLGCEVWDSYSTEEFGCLAWQCPQGTNLHIADELVLLEVIDDMTGKPCGPGETGSVIITSFFNQAMPQIRYKLGDLATVGPPCACGRGLTSLASIVGRRRQLFRFPNGDTVMPGLATKLFDEFLHARKWQAAQISGQTIEIRFVSDVPEDQQDRAAFVDAANRRFQQKLTYVFRQVDAIATQPSGKFFEYVCELPE